MVRLDARHILVLEDAKVLVEFATPATSSTNMHSLLNLELYLPDPKFALAIVDRDHRICNLVRIEDIFLKADQHISCALTAARTCAQAA